MFGRGFSQAFLDTFFPRSCVHCGEGADGDRYQFLCQACSREIFLSRPPSCTTCGYPFFGLLSGSRVCPHCEALEPLFDEGRTLFLAKGPARSLIHELKYNSGFYILEDVRAMIESTPYYRNYFDGATLVPVPLHATKERERGFNQSREIARAICAVTGASGVADVLERRVYTQTQTRLSREARHQNVKNAFALAADGAVMVNKSYILVDDVFTTGSTLNACAAVLRDAGVTRLKVATLGHG
ncbi:MAG: ComF family protein [Verrucomicrobia bacterium]|jgi:ComF family protein|nr:ComF family protein [Verrucomicrobiota bacterium]